MKQRLPDTLETSVYYPANSSTSFEHSTSKMTTSSPEERLSCVESKRINNHQNKRTQGLSTPSVNSNLMKVTFTPSLFFMLFRTSLVLLSVFLLWFAPAFITDLHIQPIFFTVTLLVIGRATYGGLTTQGAQCTRRSRAFQLMGRGFAVLGLFFFMGNVAQAQVSGTVFRDFNANGTKGNATPNLEPGVPDIIVNAYNSAGTIIASFKSDATGTYSIPASGSAYNGTEGSNTGFVPAATAVRIEFEIPSDLGYNFSSGGGTTYRSSVQFVTASATEVNFALNNPGDYCETTNPYIAIPCYENGSGVGSSNPAVVTFTYNASGTTPAASYDFQTQQVGATWGIALQRSKKWVFASAFLKRHVGFGPRGADGVYVLDYSTVTPTLVGGFDLQGIMPNNGGPTIDLGSINRTNVAGAITSGAAGDFQLSADNTSPTRDLDAFGKIFKMSYGDIDMEEDESNLWLVNLYQNALIAVDMAAYTPSATNPNTLSMAAVRQYPLSGFSGLPSCTNGSIRPFGLKFHNGKGYLGLVCDAASSSTIVQPSELVAFIVSFDPKNPTAFTTVLTFDLDYTREPYYRQLSGANNVDSNWERWMDTWDNTQVTANGAVFGDATNLGFTNAAQPIVADIEFANNGDMIIGLMDRWPHQQGWFNYRAISGTTLFANGGGSAELVYAGNSGGSYVLEQGENDTRSTPSGFLTNDGPTNAGEFFWGDYYTGSDASHHETSLGSLALLQGTNEVVAPAFDPDGFFSQGIKWLSLTTGNYTDAYRIVTGSFSSPDGFGKGSALGDVEVICAAQPVEIGNRVWADTDNDGIQDAGEAGIGNVTIQLFADFNNDGIPDGAALDSTITSNSGDVGTWYFNASNVTDGDPTVADNQAGPQPGRTYLIRVGSADWDDGTGQGVGDLAGLVLTSSNVGGSGQPDVRDNDATISANIPTISYTVGLAGQNDHSLDMGFNEVVYASVDLALRKVVDNVTTPGPFYPGSQVAYTITIYNQETTGVDAVHIQDYIPTDMTWISGTTGAVTSDNGNTINIINNGAGTFILDTLAPMDEVNLTIILKINQGFLGTELTNWAEIRSFDTDNNGSTPAPADIDSTPNAINFSEATETNDLHNDNVIDENGKNGGDEDDHDPARITVTPCPSGNCRGVAVTINNE